MIPSGCIGSQIQCRSRDKPTLGLSTSLYTAQPNALVSDSSQKLKVYLSEWTELWLTCTHWEKRQISSKSYGLAAILTEVAGNFSSGILHSRMWYACHAFFCLCPPLPVLPHVATAPGGMCQCVVRTDLKLSTNLIYQASQGENQCKSE